MEEEADFHSFGTSQLEAISKLGREGHAATALRLAVELRRRAKEQRDLDVYLMSGFHILNKSADMCQPELRRQTAIENIALLESEEQAIQFQSDHDRRSYDHQVHWMSACSYDNLADAVAQMNGFNSEGMPACINDGISVCRRTGKLLCIT